MRNRSASVTWTRAAWNAGPVAGVTATFVQVVTGDRVGLLVPSRTNVVTRFDEVVTPFRASCEAEPRARAIVVQDRRRLDFSGHVALLHGAVALQALRDCPIVAQILAGRHA